MTIWELYAHYNHVIVQVDVAFTIEEKNDMLAVFLENYPRHCIVVTKYLIEETK